MALTDPYITIVSCGPGSPDYIPPIARKAIADADVLVGAPRLLALFPEPDVRRHAVRTDIAGVLETLACYSQSARIVVLVTGDAGLFSLSRSVIKRFGRACCQVIPGISSVQLAFARLGLDWADARIISLHQSIPAKAEPFAPYAKIAILAGGAPSLQWIREQWQQTPKTPHRVFIMEHLSLDSERIHEIPAPDQDWGTCAPPAIVLLVDRELL